MRALLRRNSLAHRDAAEVRSEGFTVLALAAASDTIARGVLLLAVYSAGLAIPFLLTALGISQFMVFYKNFRKYLHAVELFSGALLLFVGGLVFVNKLTWLSAKLTFLNRFSL